jgi:hypothetical protein
MEASQAQRQQQPPPSQQPDAAVLGALTVILLSGASIGAMVPLLVPLLASYGITRAAIRDTLDLLVPHLSGGIGLPLLGDILPPPGSAQGFIFRTAAPRHAAYLVNGARRLSRSPSSIQTERRYLAQHVDAERGRREAAQRVDVVASLFGPELGWNNPDDSKTSRGCRAMIGKNFSVAHPPLVEGHLSYPGAVHPACRCFASAPFAHRTLRIAKRGAPVSLSQTASIFDVSRLDEWGRKVIAEVERRCTFDLNRLRPELRRQTHRDTIRVVVKPLGPDPNADVAVEEGLLEVNADMQPGGRDERPLETVAAYVIGELGHFVDDYLLTDSDRTAIYRAVHGSPPDDHVTLADWFRARNYWSRVGETFMAAFISAYSDLKPDQAHFTYRSNPQAAALLRRLLGD